MKGIDKITARIEAEGAAEAARLAEEARGVSAVRDAQEPGAERSVR